MTWTYVDAKDRVGELEAEIERLRAALERIAKSDVHNFDTLHPDSCARVARAALRETEKEEKSK